MGIQLQINELLGEVKLGNFNLGQIHGFPESEWHSRRTYHAELTSWFNGEKLNEKQTQGGRTVEKFPIKINPIRGAVYKHAYALFGEVPDDSKPLAVPILKPWDRSGKEKAQKGQEFLSRVWYENHGRTLMLANGIMSQILGGSLLKASYVPEQTWRSVPIRLETIHPSNFVGIPMAGDHYRLEEAWLVKAISAKEAYRLYEMEFPEEEMVYYVEYWNPEYYEITINGIFVPSNKVDPLTGEKLLFHGENQFGEVPIFYNPHIRTTDWYGDSLITQNVQGIVEEMNKRVADYGDAVSDDSHRYYVLKNVSGKPDVYELAPGVRVVQLPSNPSITGKEAPADMDELGSAQASAAMKQLNDQLYEHFRREAFIPAVADGEDEGSQRSALTLAMRMWPLLSHTSMERVFFGDSLALLDRLIMKMGVLTKHELAPPKECIDMRIERRWSPMLPRDREVFINELVNRAATNLGSLTHLLSLIEDIEDPEGEYEVIKKQMKDLAKAEALANPPQPGTKPGQAANQQKSSEKDANKQEKTS